VYLASIESRHENRDSDGSIWQRWEVKMLDHPHQRKRLFKVGGQEGGCQPEGRKIEEHGRLR
jgi:hypothetical protein